MPASHFRNDFTISYFARERHVSTNAPCAMSGKLVKLLASEEARKYFAKANQEYLHWEKAKHLATSAAISPGGSSGF